MFDIAFDNVNEIIGMNGHGIYVWSAYSIAISIIIVSFIVAKNRIKGVKRKIKIKNAPS
jgi:heme exporter protein D